VDFALGHGHALKNGEGLFPHPGGKAADGDQGFDFGMVSAVFVNWFVAVLVLLFVMVGVAVVMGRRVFVRVFVFVGMFVFM
jgi:hypothetical protein